MMGKQRANTLLLAAEKLSARGMYDAGMVTKVIEAETLQEFRDGVSKIAKRIGAYNAESLRMAKAQVNRPSVLAGQREASMWEEVDLRVRLNSDEAKAAMKAFQGKGKAEESKL